MEPTLSSETSAFILRTPGKFPKEHRLHSEHGESLKTTMRLRVYMFYIVYLYSIVQVLVLMAFNNYSVIYATQQDVQEKKTNFVVSQKATAPCAGKAQFGIFTLIRKLLGKATNKSCLNWTSPHFKTPTAMFPKQATVHIEFSKPTFPLFSSLTITGKGGICPPHESGSVGAVQCVQCVQYIAHMQGHKHFALRYSLERLKLVR